VETRRGTKKVGKDIVWVKINLAELEEELQYICRNLAMPPEKGVIDPK